MAVGQMFDVQDGLKLKKSRTAILGSQHSDSSRLVINTGMRRS